MDTQLDDTSAATIASQRSFLLSAQQCFTSIQAPAAEDAADLALLRDNIDSSLFTLDVLQTYRYHPQDYVDNDRVRPLLSAHCNERHGADPAWQCPRAPGNSSRAVLEQARANVKEADPVFISTALDENAGNLDLLQQIGAMVPAVLPSALPL